MKISKKISIFITTFVLIFGTQFIQPKKAEAGFLDDFANIGVFVKEYGLDGIISSIADRFLNKIVTDTLTWANGGFGKEGPGFIDNWDDFLHGTKHDLISDAFNVANTLVDKGENKCDEDKILTKKALKKEDKVWNKCMKNDIDGELESFCTEEADKAYLSVMETCDKVGSIYAGLSGIAEKNYHDYIDGKTIMRRSVAMSIANFGAKTLNLDPVNDLIAGKGNTLTYLLGSQAGVDDFGKDITKGGWTAYMALSDPHNYSSGLTSLVSGAIDTKTKTAIKNSIDSQQTNKQLDKRDCAEWDTSVKPKKCKRYVIKTTGDIVSAKIKEAILKDEKKATLADELTEVLVAAVGRLAGGLLDQGIAGIGKKRNKSFEKNKKQDIETFGNSYQNEYDVIGVYDDAQIFNENNNTTETQNVENENIFNNIFEKGAGDDASIPYVGGPEDLKNLAWNEGPELIVELKGNLEKVIDLTKDVIDLNRSIKSELNNTLDRVMKLDYCRPGPDFGWEERYNDQAQDIIYKRIKDKDKCAEIKSNAELYLIDIGFPLIKATNMDTYLNIPGSEEMSSRVNYLLGDKNKASFEKTQDELKKKKSLYSILLQIKQKVKESFTERRNKIDSRIPIFTDDIYKLTEDNDGNINKENILSDQDIIEILSIKSSTTEEEVDNDNEKPIARCKDKTILVSTGKSIKILPEYIDNGSTDNVAIYSMIVSPNSFMSNELGTHNVKLSLTDTSKNTDSCNAKITIVDKKNNTKKKLSNIFNTKKVFALKTDSKTNSKYKTNYLIEERGLYVFKGDETPETLVANNRKKAEEIIISLGWNIWRNDDVDSEHKKIKSRLRYQYQIIKNDLTTEKEVLELKIKLEKTLNAGKVIDGYLNDCYVFLKMVHNEGNYLSDPVIKNILESEYQKQQNKQNSMFKTSLFTSPSHINSSILSFKNISDVGKYYDDMYPDNIQKPADIKAILGRDQTLRTIFQNNSVPTTISFGDPFPVLAGGLIGLFLGEEASVISDNNYKKTLFCHAKYPGFENGCWDGGSRDMCNADISQERFGQKWYYSKKIDYRAALLGI